MAHEASLPPRSAGERRSRALLSSAAILAAGWLSAFSPSAAAPPLKAIGPPGLAGQAGLAVVAEYGSFTVYRVDAGDLAALSPAARSELRLLPEADLLRFEAGSFDPLGEGPAVPPQLAAEPSGEPSLWLVQFVGPLKEEWLERVRETGAKPIHYLPSHGYLLWADGASRDDLARLVAEGGPLRYSGPYHPYFKLAAGLREDLRTAAPAEAVDVAVQVYPHAGSGETEGLIAARALAGPARSTPVLGLEGFVVRLALSDLPALARRPEVIWIEEPGRPRPLDEVPCQIVAGAFDATQSGPLGPGYLAWLTGLGFGSDPAGYPIVDLVDTGIGTGSTLSGDPTLHRLGSLSLPTRLAYVRTCNPTGDGGDVSGHGHLNVSVAGGYDPRSGPPFQDGGGFRLGIGINPFGRFAGTQVFDADDDLDVSLCGAHGLDYPGLLASVYGAGARIANASWGEPVSPPGRYGLLAQAFDAATRDAQPAVAGSQPLALVVAAGNSGPGAATIATPALAKNVIAVGASESDRPTFTCGGWAPAFADDAMDLAPFSSRGPAGQRVKPELVAPGTHVQGTASTHPGYDGHGLCGLYLPPGQTTFSASIGTSQAAPAVAGAASLLWPWLEDRYGLAPPSPAMLKAYLIAHTTYLSGEGAGDDLPSNGQGFGMPNLGLAFEEVPRQLVDQGVVLDATGATHALDLVVGDGSRPLRVVLAYTDKPGPLQTTTPEVNDLDLEVTVGSTLYRGNRFSGAWSVAGGVPDAHNNSEAVFLPAGISGAFTVTVRASQIADDGVPGLGDGTDQDFALVCTNCVPSLPEVWVDFAYDGPESGSFGQPFDSLAEGVAAVAPGGAVHLKPGTTTEAPTLTKPMTLDAAGGLATIGG